LKHLDLRRLQVADHALPRVTHHEIEQHLLHIAARAVLSFGGCGRILRSEPQRPQDHEGNGANEKGPDSGPALEWLVERLTPPASD
jgi:hypothetical protein